MAKNKLLYVIGERLFECLQRLSIATYSNKMNNNYFEFEPYFELTYKQSIKYSLEHLNITDVEKYREVFCKYFLEVYKLSEESAILYLKMDISNRKRLNHYWIYNRGKFLEEILNI